MVGGWGSLLRTDASFAESLYGLRRVATATSTQPKPTTDLLSARSRWLSLLWLVGVPYVKAKLDALHATRVQRSWLQPSATGAREVCPPPVCGAGGTQRFTWCGIVASLRNEYTVRSQRSNYHHQPDTNKHAFGAASRRGAPREHPLRGVRRARPRAWPHCCSWCGKSLPGSSLRSRGAPPSPHRRVTSLHEAETSAVGGVIEHSAGDWWRCFRTYTPRTKALRWATALRTCWEAHISALPCTRWASKCSALRLSISCVPALVWCPLPCRRIEPFVTDCGVWSALTGGGHSPGQCTAQGGSAEGCEKRFRRVAVDGAG